MDRSFWRCSDVSRKYSAVFRRGGFRVTPRHPARRTRQDEEGSPRPSASRRHSRPRSRVFLLYRVPSEAARSLSGSLPDRPVIFPGRLPRLPLRQLNRPDLRDFLCRGAAAGWNGLFSVPSHNVFVFFCKKKEFHAIMIIVRGGGTMFGRSKIQALEEQVHDLELDLEQATKENEKLTEQLKAAKKKAADLEKEYGGTDVDTLREQLRSSQAEYEGLKELYNNKIREFDSSKEEKEQEFAKTAAVQRYNLENEIRDNRQANRDYVSNTVKTFSDSYNYYLNQIKLLMDALGDVASRAGESLFHESNEDLKTKLGQQMAEKIKAETDPLRSNNGDLILIGTTDDVQISAAEEAGGSAAPEAVAESKAE